MALEEHTVVTHRLEDLRSVVVDRVLATPLLQNEDDDGDEESDPVTLAEEEFLQTQTLTGFLLLLDGGLNFCHLVTNTVISGAQAAIVGKILKGLFGATNRREPTGRFLHREKTEGEDARWDELETEWDSPYSEA